MKAAYGGLANWQISAAYPAMRFCEETVRLGIYFPSFLNAFKPEGLVRV